MQKQMILLKNLSCPSCAAKLESAAKKLPGVIKAQVSFGTGALNLEFDEAKLDHEQLRTVIRQLGLDVVSVMNRPSI